MIGYENRPFPSPYGVTVIKSIPITSMNEQRKKLFPSPYGVTVIKSYRRWRKDKQERCFRPLTG